MATTKSACDFSHPNKVFKRTVEFHWFELMLGWILRCSGYYCFCTTLYFSLTLILSPFTNLIFVCDVEEEEMLLRMQKQFKYDC